jgi:hypothetical protein
MMQEMVKFFAIDESKMTDKVVKYHVKQFDSLLAVNIVDNLSMAESKLVALSQNEGNESKAAELRFQLATLVATRTALQGIRDNLQMVFDFKV